MLTRLWLLLFFIIALSWIDIRNAFEVYRKDKNKGKLLLHAILIIVLGIIVFDGTYYVASTELDTLNSQTYEVKRILGDSRKGHGFKTLSKRLIRKRKSIAVNDKTSDSD
jgi:hypothetical protein